VRRALLIFAVAGSGCSLLAPSDAELRDDAFCQHNPDHTFCADFETGALTDNWSLEQSAGTVEVDEGALVTTLNVGADGVSAQAVHGVQLTSRVQVELDLEVDRGSDTTTAQVQPVRLTLLPPPSGYDALSVSVAVDDIGPAVEVESQPSGGAPATPQTAIAGSLAGWHHLRLEWSLANGSLTLTLDGKTAAMAETPHVSAKSAQLQLGAASVTAVKSAWRIRHDNVLIDADGP
jgi:hypothetical protein